MQLRRRVTISNEYRLELRGMTCGSCERIIERIVGRNGGQTQEIDANSGVVRFTCDENAVSRIKKEFSDKGFVEKSEDDLARGNPEHIFTYISDIVSAAKNVEAEALLINYSVAGILATGFALAAAYFLMISKAANGSAYVPFLFLSGLCSVSIIYSYNNAKCYGKNISCTNGMMVGMIMGMIPGFMVGAIIGATNGMFMGSVIGMAVGIVLGVKAGKSCGIMGAMEGVMAGLMAGIMGAMTSVMMLNDNLIAFLLILFAVCGAMLFGMSYLLHREIGARDGSSLGTSMAKFSASCAALGLLLALIMFLGPKGPLTFI